MRIQVLYFAAARERAGVSREELEVPEGASVRAAVELIASRHPRLRELLPHLRIAVNQEFGRQEDALPNGAELALIPPVAGGAGLFLVVDRPLDLAEVIAAVSGEAYGGLATFIGTLKPGELAVVIAAAAPHRREAFRACEYAIDRIKADAPIWKKECYEDGEVWVGIHP